MFNKPKNVNVTITTNTIIKAILLVVIIGFLIRIIGLITYPLQLIAASLFMAIALNPAVSWLSKHVAGKSRVRATAIAYITVLAVLTLFAVIILPPLIRQGVDTVSNIPTNINDLNNQDTPVVRFIQNANLTDEYAEFMSSIKGNIQQMAGRVVDTVSTIGSLLFSLITVAIMTFMMLVEGPSWIKRFWEMQPTDNLKKHKHMTARMYRMVTGYVNGQFLIATIAATFAFVAMIIASHVFGATINALALALIVGLIGLIPMFGNTIAAVVVVLVCAFVSIPLAATMGIFFLLYQQIENATLQPYIQAKYNELTPLTVFVAALLGVSIAGFLGALVAIPVAGCIRIIFLEVYETKYAPMAKKEASKSA